MRRRAFITVLGGAAMLAPAGQAQQPDQMRRVGVLIPWPERDPIAQATVIPFAQRLQSFGWLEGKTLRIDWRFAANDPGLFKSYAAELAGLAPDVLLASTPPALLALREKTRSIPIVFVLAVDPVGMGLVQSLARPGGNITGIGTMDPPMMGKWLQLLKEVAPNVMRVAVIFSPNAQPYARFLNSAIEAAASTMGIAVTLAPVEDDATIQQAIAAQAREPGGGLVCLPDSFIVSNAGEIVDAAIRQKLPLIGLPPLVRAGGLMSYFTDPIDVHVQAASYIDRILRGASPSDLPVQQPTKYALIINLKTAKTLGLTVPPTMLDLADEVIE
jgi:putative ABC transport system substrate-binding protein